MNAVAGTRCPDEATIARAATEGANAELQGHLAGCASCAEDWRLQREMVRLGAALPFTPPDPGHRQRLRAQLLIRAELSQRGAPSLRAAVERTGEHGLPEARVMPSAVRRRAWRWHLAAGAAGALAAAGLLVFFVRGGRREAAPLVQAPPPVMTPDPAPALRPPATLRGSPGARYLVESGPPHERVRLQEGRLIAEVTPARRGESFRIVTARGEVEVRGTIFETVATVAGLQAVSVQRGRVVVRPDPGTEVTLVAGQRWQRPPERPPAAPPAPASRRPLAPPIPAAPGRHWQAAGDVPRPATGDGPPMVWPDLDGKRSGPAASGAEQAFGEGLRLLRTGQHVPAAEAFDRATAAAPVGPLAEDAGYWRAVALARARAAAGEQALAQFLARYPLSARRGEAAVMLGWLVLDRGDRAVAERHFRTGLSDRSARVRASAEAGLARLAGRPASPR